MPVCCPPALRERRFVAVREIRAELPGRDLGQAHPDVAHPHTAAVAVREMMSAAVRTHFPVVSRHACSPLGLRRSRVRAHRVERRINACRSVTCASSRDPGAAAECRHPVTAQRRFATRRRRERRVSAHKWFAGRESEYRPYRLPATTGSRALQTRPRSCIASTTIAVPMVISRMSAATRTYLWPAGAAGSFAMSTGGTS